MDRVIVLDKLAEEGLELLEQAQGIEFDVRTGLKGDDLRAALAEYDGAICRSGVRITLDSLEGNRRLKAIVRAGVGTDNIDKPAATRRGIVVMNTPSGNTLSTAEHTFALMMALSRNIAPAHRSLVEGKWNRGAYMGAQLADKTLGIVGLGRIGQEVAKRALAFE
ncbi:MAG: NAD(P)-dependent oxidoreductase, partial [Pirellulaceae bacterium]|nr:NAD(P)-dependent oxidoreductase [Pirellulaceae bacterium]